MHRHPTLVVAGVSLLVTWCCSGSESEPSLPVSWEIGVGAGDPAEFARLAGEWHVLDSKGKPLLDKGAPKLVRFDRGDVEVLSPEGNKGRLDFLLPDGSRILAIYLLRDGTLMVSQTKTGRPRPNGFHAGPVITVWKARRP